MESYLAHWLSALGVLMFGASLRMADGIGKFAEGEGP